MTTIEFWARVNADRTVTLPPEAVERVQRDQPIRVILVVPESEEDRAWADLTADQFLQGYAEDDAIYDDLPTG